MILSRIFAGLVFGLFIMTVLTAAVLLWEGPHCVLVPAVSGYSPLAVVGCPR